MTKQGKDIPAGWGNPKSTLRCYCTPRALIQGERSTRLEGFFPGLGCVHMAGLLCVSR